ncbi:MAG: ferritin-like domain-containing protein [Nitrospirales bacterium]
MNRLFTNNEGEDLTAAQNGDVAGTSRRNFLTGSAKLIGGGALAVALAGSPIFSGAKSVLAQSTTAAAPNLTDIDILNYALTLEHLEAAFYVQGLNTFTMTDFTSARFIRGFGGKITSRVYGYFQLIRDHEVTHVQTLISVIQSLGGTPVGPCTYNFGYSNVDQYVAVAQALEDTGVMAYDGAIALIQNPDLQTAGATIATVEARHAAYLRLLNGNVPFPAAFDTPKTMAEILALIAPFIVSCP